MSKIASSKIHFQKYFFQIALQKIHFKSYFLKRDIFKFTLLKKIPFQNTILKLLFQNCSLKQYILKIALLKITLNVQNTFSKWLSKNNLTKDTFSKVLSQKTLTWYLLFVRIIIRKKITQIIIDMPNFLFSNCIYNLLKTLADNNSYLFWVQNPN